MELETILQKECRNEDGFRFVFELKKDPRERYVSQIVTLYDNEDTTKEIGHFKVDGFSEDVNIVSPYNLHHTMDMTILLNDEFQKRGLSRSMIKYLFENSESYFGSIPLHQNIYIDADGSDKFWDCIGMRPNTRTYTTVRKLRGKGYEKFISYGDLLKWIYKKGGKKRKTKKQLKSRKKRKPKTKK